MSPGSAAGLRELLAGCPANHRKAVARAIGLRADSAATSIAAALSDEQRLETIVAGLSPAGRAAATAGAFDAGAGLMLSPRHDNVGARELEHHGLAYAFGGRWAREYIVPADLVAPLRRVRAAAHAKRIPEQRSAGARFAGAPLQIAHDAATLSAFMAREPIRVKADGDIYARTLPKLAAALAPIPGAEVATPIAPVRVSLALEWLRAERLLRLRVDDLPGREERRELVPAGDIGAVLAAGPAALRERLSTSQERFDEVRCLAALMRALGERVVGLEALGETLQALMEEAGMGSHRQFGAIELALSCVMPLWLAGEAELGLDGEGGPVAARLAALIASPPPEARLGIAQANFEIVLLRAPVPAERFVLELCCERGQGQEHVYAITRGAARAAERAGAGSVAGALAALVGELPQNVERSLADWTRDVRPPLRLRSAMLVDAGDAQTAQTLADGPLAGLVVERIGASMLAVPADRVDAVARALAAAGSPLEPGLERISGTWRETRSHGSGRAHQTWETDADDEPIGRGPQVSTIEETPAARATPAKTAHRPGAPGEPLAVLLEALENDEDVAIVYAGARGVTHRIVTPTEVDEARLHAYCHLRDDARAFWLSSILAAAPVPG